MEIGNLYYDLEINDKKLDNQLSEADSKVKGFGSKFASLGAAMAKGLAIGGAAVAAFGALSVKNFTESQNVMAQTNAVLKSTGAVAGVSAKQVSDLASSLQSVTKFSDETIQGGENLLLTFTKIGKDIFPQATEVMVDMSQALGQDMKSSAIQLGKALQDPVLGVTALRRVGVNFNSDQQEVIKNLVETGKSAEAQQMILKELTTEFGGSAKAAGKTFSGQLVILKNTFSDLLEGIGMTITRGIDPFVRKFNGWLKSIGGAEGLMNGLIGSFQLLTTGFTEDEGPFNLKPDSLFIRALQLVHSTLVAIGDISAKVFQSLKLVWDFLSPSVTELANTIKNQLWPQLQQLWAALEPGFTTAMKALAFVFGVVVVGALKLMVEALNVTVTIFGFITDKVATLVGWFGNLIGATGNLAATVIYWFSGIKQHIGGVVDSIVGFFTNLPSKLIAVGGKVTDAIASPFKQAFNAIAKFWNNTVGKLVFKAPSWVPGLGGKGWEMPKLPVLDTGALVTGPTLAALAVNNKPEMVIPLDKMKDFGNNTFTGNIYLGSAGAVTEFFDRLNRNQELQSMGVSPV